MINKRCNGVIHVIKKGDSLYYLSRYYRVPLAMILRANPYVDVYNLQVGQEICIPVQRAVVPTEPQTPETQAPEMETPEMETPEMETPEMQAPTMPQPTPGTQAPGMQTPTMPQMTPGMQTPTMPQTTPGTQMPGMQTPTMPQTTPGTQTPEMQTPLRNRIQERFQTPGGSQVPSSFKIPSVQTQQVPLNQMPMQQNPNMQNQNNYNSTERPMSEDKPEWMKQAEKAGQEMEMQNTFLYVVKKNDTLGGILNIYGVSLEDFLKMNDINNIVLHEGTAIRLPKKTQ